MQLVRGLYNWESSTAGCVATIGNFDGVHRGHNEIFKNLVKLSKQLELPSVVITFEPLPHEFFSPDTRTLRLQTFRDRIQTIASCGVDKLVLLRFDNTFANQQADTFIRDTLLRELQVKHLLVGDDFQFGKDRQGDIKLLEHYANAGEFSVTSTSTILDEEQRISSTRIRECLLQSDCTGAQNLLGRPLRISGRVARGAQLGRTLGFPTANVALKNHRPLLRGVFAVETLWQGKVYPSVANLGERPTVDGKQLLLEVNLLDENTDLYGEYLAIDFQHHIRNEMKFDSLEQLKEAITRDAQTARDYFKSQTDT